MRCRCLILALVAIFCLWGCAPEPVATEPVTEPVTESVTEPVTTAPPATEPATTLPQVVITEPTQPEHSPLYLEDVTLEDVVLWFSEVCLDGEIINSGDPSKVQRWESPICYQIHGQPTDRDLEVLESFAAWLNEMEGFPGMTEAVHAEDVNLNIYFTDQQGLLDVMGENFTDVDGALTFWYDDMDVIYTGNICIRTDLDQELRNSVILEEVYNCLGPVQDTLLRPDSIIYQHFSQPQALTAVDELIIKLLYHPQIQCGMDSAACQEVLGSIYY